MTSTSTRRFLISVGIPLLVAFVGAFLGMFLPIAAYELTHSESFHPHNVFWESIFGIGFYVAGFFDSCRTSGWVPIVGFAGWPLLVMRLYSLSHAGFFAALVIVGYFGPLFSCSRWLSASATMAKTICRCITCHFIGTFMRPAIDPGHLTIR
jgi:hypothetical protein